MKRYLVLFFLITSCHTETDWVIDKADYFIKNSASDFLENQELMNYSYNKRSQFYFQNSEHNKFRIMTFEQNLRFYCFSDSCLLDKKIGIRSPQYLKKGFYNIKNDTISLDFNKDSIIDVETKFNTNPIEIFEKHKTELKKLGIHSYSARPAINLYYVYLNSTFVLLKSDKIENYISEKDKIIKNYENNWHLIKRSSSIEF